MKTTSKVCFICKRQNLRLTDYLLSGAKKGIPKEKLLEYWEHPNIKLVCCHCYLIVKYILDPAFETEVVPFITHRSYTISFIHKESGRIDCSQLSQFEYDSLKLLELI